MNSIKLPLLLRLCIAILIPVPFFLGDITSSIIIVCSLITLIWVMKIFYTKKYPYVEQIDLLMSSACFLDMLGFAYFFRSDIFWFWDEVMHFGLSIVFLVFFFYIFFIAKVAGNIHVPRMLGFFIVFAVLMFCAALWEILEYSIDQATHSPIMQSDIEQSPLDDTMHDLIMAFLAGGLFFIGGVLWELFCRKKSINSTDKNAIIDYSFLKIDGSLRDIVVQNTTLSDWEILYKSFLNSKYEVIYLRNGERYPPPCSVSILFNEKDVTHYLKVITNSITFGCASIYEQEVEFDIDPSEFTSKSQKKEIEKFMKYLSTIVQKNVQLFYEGERKNSIFSIDTTP